MAEKNEKGFESLLILFFRLTRTACVPLTLQRVYAPSAASRTINFASGLADFVAWGGLLPKKVSQERQPKPGEWFPGCAITSPNAASRSKRPGPKCTRF